VSYIDKNSSVVVSARLTNKGRELLSTGLLTFDTFRLGDSEIDYTTLGSSYDITLNNVLRAKSSNPDIKTPLYIDNLTTTPDVNIPQLTPIIIDSVIQSPTLGFFNGDLTATTITFTAKTTTDYVLQSDAIISLSGLTGTTNIVNINQSTNYSGNTYEPTEGDFLLVRMSNDELTSPLNSGVIDIATPFLWFKIQNVSGSLSANTLQVTLDRNFPYFPGYVGSNYSEVYIFPSGNPFTTSGLYSGGTVWNMNNVWSYNIPGVDTITYEGFDKYGSENFIGSKEYFGYTSELQNNTGNTFCNWINSIGIIHFSNVQTCDNQTENILGQKFYIEENDEYPSLAIPTLMWHRETGNTIGHIFKGIGSEILIKSEGVDTKIKYYNLADQFNNVVGRIFPDLHTFTIDDQELVAALSYKSNRNWSLPTLQTDTKTSSDGIIDGTQNLFVTYLLESTTGYTTGLHCQNVVCVNFGELGDCPPSLKKSVEVVFPAGQLPHMSVSGGTGWYADRLYLLVQRKPLGQNPEPDEWRIIDVTSSINLHTPGNRINPINLENTTFTITNTLYSGATIYNLHDYINIAETSETNLLQFGDESFFYGNVITKGLTTKYRTKFNFTIEPTKFNKSVNPTYENSGQNIHISEVGVYSGTDLVAIGKMNLPIEKKPETTVIIEMAFDL
jgi:hypothetical protein